MEKSKIKKRIFMSVAFLIILLIILLGIMAYYVLADKNYNARKEMIYINSEKWNGETYPDGMPNLYRNYSGSLTCQNIGKSFYYVVNEVIPQYISECKNYNEDELKHYFEKNSENIALSVGITKYDDFRAFINKLKEVIKTEDIKFESFYIDDDTVKKASNVTRANLCIKYENCNELVLFIKINGSKKTNSSAIEYK